MPANTAPVFPLTPVVSGVTLTTAAADYDGTGGNNGLAYTAGSNPSYVPGIRAKAKGTNVASVARVFLNNGSTNGTGSNNFFLGEFTLPATTAIATAATAELYFPINEWIPAGWRIYIGLGTTVAAGWTMTVCGMDS